MHYLVATASVHVTAAACDLLGEDLDDGDAVTVLGVVEASGDGDGTEAGTPGSDPDPLARDAGTPPARDLDDALNVARSRLAGADLSIERRDGAPDEVIPDVAREIGADRIVMGVNRGTPDATGLGGTTSSVLVGAEIPVTVVPVA